METYEVINTRGWKSQFKSYYVVWKLFCSTDETKKQIQFKSYYVVWKQEDDQNTKDDR